MVIAANKSNRIKSGYIIVNTPYADDVSGMKLATYPQENRAVNILTAKPHGIPNLTPPGVQPSADHCISLCPGSTRPDIFSGLVN